MLSSNFWIRWRGGNLAKIAESCHIDQKARGNYTRVLLIKFRGVPLLLVGYSCCLSEVRLIRSTVKAKRKRKKDVGIGWQGPRGYGIVLKRKLGPLIVITSYFCFAMSRYWVHRCAATSEEYT